MLHKQSLELLIIKFFPQNFVSQHIK